MNLEKCAIVCLPGSALDRGLRMRDRGNVDIAEARRQHDNYCQALRGLGYSLTTIPANDNYPDSVFVEDPAVIVRDLLIITRLRHKERQGEEKLLAQELRPFFKNVAQIEPPGFIEGGDVLVTDKRLYVGLSERTNEEGAEQLAKVVYDRFGTPTYSFKIPDSFLHLKGEAAFHRDGGIVTVSEEIADRFSDSGYRLVVTPSAERFGGNCISSGDQILVHAGRTKTKELLEKAGFQTRKIDISEFEKIDGAMTCLSKLWIRAN